MVSSDQIDSSSISRDMTDESMEVEFLEHIEGKGLSASWPGHHPKLGEMTILEVMHTGSTLQAFAAERGASICCVPEGAACQGAPPPGRQNMLGAAATADTLADHMSDGKSGQEPSSPPALACTTKSEDGCSSGGQAGEQWPDFSGKSGSKDRSGASLGVRSTSAPLSVVSKTVKETHAERNRQAQRRYRQRQREKIKELQARLLAEQGENEEVMSRSNMLAHTLQMRKEELRQLRARQAAHADVEEDALLRKFNGSVTLTFRADRTVTLTPQQIKGMSEKDLARTWTLYVKELAVLLLATEGQEAPPEVLSRIQTLVQRELLFLYFQAALTNTTSVNRFMATAVVEDMRVPLGREGPAMWRKVAEAIQLTREQRAEIVELWRTFREKLQALVPARAEIHANIAATVPMGTMAGDFAEQFLAAHEGMHALKRNLRSEHVLIHEFLLNFYTQKLTVIQMAHCVVRSFPYYPDILAIVLWVAAAENDACAISVLQHASPEATSGHCGDGDQSMGAGH